MKKLLITLFCLMSLGSIQAENNVRDVNPVYVISTNRNGAITHIKSIENTPKASGGPVLGCGSWIGC